MKIARDSAWLPPSTSVITIATPACSWYATTIDASYPSEPSTTRFAARCRTCAGAVGNAPTSGIRPTSTIAEAVIV